MADKKKIEIFKVRKTATKKHKKTETLPTESAEVKEAVDSFVTIAEEIAALELEIVPHKRILKDYAEERFSERYMEGVKDNFKIEGNGAEVYHIVSSNGRPKSEEGLEEFQKIYGQKITNKLYEFDINSVHLSQEFLAQGDNREKFEAAIAVLGQEFIDKLFTGGSYKVLPGAMETAKDVSETPEEFRKLVFADLQLISYLKRSPD